MRILASFALIISASMSVPVCAMEYQPTAAISTSNGNGLQARTASRKIVDAPRRQRYKVHRRSAGTVVPVDQREGFIITDFKPDDNHLYAARGYLPPKTDDLSFAETNVAPIKLHKVGFTSVVASVKYRF
jgi:hypothetical protein